MIYKAFKDGISLSWLGMGCMRLPTLAEGGGIDEAKAQEMIDCAIANGVNYFDTAYGYHGGESEVFTGKALRRHARDKWYLATKLPGHMMRYSGGKITNVGYMAGKPVMTIPEIFESQLAKCGVDYFDFYLLHNVCETSYDFYTNEELGVVRYLLEQKKAGRIRYLGLSAHGRADCIERFLDRWPGVFEFAQIQLNYLDWLLQDAGKKYMALVSRKVPVIAMEPCRGGRLASLSDEANATLKAARPDDSIASWAFRYLQSLDGLTVALSGMTTLDQLKENIKIFSKNDPTTPQEKELLNSAIAGMLGRVPCTACRYCTDGCPQSLDIPKLISMYNELSHDKQLGLLNFTLGAMNEGDMPSACIECGACSDMCPQGIDVPAVMRRFAAALKHGKG